MGTDSRSESHTESEILADTTRKTLIAVLKSMADGSAQSKYLLINEIIERSGLDERDVQRSLYILEGQKLVCPLPEGDFTSKHWQLTTDGTKILKLIATSAPQ